MNSTFKKSTLAVVLSFCMLSLVAFNTAAVAKNAGTNKTIEKAREAVNQASSDDWMTYAVSAEKCIRKNINLKEAAEWLDRSLAIKETPYNLKVKGLYYEKNNLPEKALEYYVKSLKVGIENDVTYEDLHTQAKVAKLAK